MNVKTTKTCKELKCICFNCPKVEDCNTNRCFGRIEKPYCEGFYLCEEKKGGK